MRKSITGKVRIKTIGILIAMLIMVLMTGCSAGSTIDAVLIINSDLSGTRKMNITISNDVFDEYFNGTIEDLNALITSSCPAAITWNYSEDETTKRYDLEIAFSSPEDYKQKVTSILGEEPAELVIQAPDTVWANGIYVKESFSDEELLSWMKSLMVNNGYVASENADKIFSTGTVEVIYQDETYRTNSRISVNQIDYVSIESINILTDINELDNFNREVQIVIPKSAMEKRSDDIQTYLGDAVPSGASSEWEVNDSGASVFHISANGLNTGGLEQFNRTVFGSDACAVTAADVSEYYSPFSFNQFIREELDLTQYLVGDYSSIYYTYQVKSPSIYKVYDSNDGSSFWESGWYASESSKYLTLHDGYYRGDPLTFNMFVQKAYNVASVDVTTTKKMFGSGWEQTISFLMEDTPTEEEASAIISSLQDRLNESRDDSEDASGASGNMDGASKASAKQAGGSVSISGEAAKSGYRVNIKREGTPEEISASSQLLFGREEVLNYARDKGFSKVKKEEAFEERLYLDGLLSSRTSDFEITYTLDLGMFTDGLYCSDDLAKIDGGKISVTSSNTNVSLQYAGTRIDPLAFLFWVFVMIGCVSVLLLLFKLGIFKAKPKQPRPQQTAPNVQGGVTVATTGTSAQGTITTANTYTVTPATQNVAATAAPTAILPQSATTTTSANTATATTAGQDTATVTTTNAVPVAMVTQNTARAAIQNASTTAAPTAMQNPTKPSQPVKIIPKFCAKCGTPRGQEELFCNSCGARFDY